jgi:hypothetical protein
MTDKKMGYTAEARRSGEWWAVRVLEVPGAFTQAKRLDQVPEMAADAVASLTGEAPGDVASVMRVEVIDEEGTP